MTENFDAASRALEIENLAKTYLDHVDDHSHPIESSVICSEAQSKLQKEFGELQKTPEEFVAVGKELETLGSKWFSRLPNVDIDARAGKIVSITFRPSEWDPNADRFSTKERFDFCNPAQTSCGE